MAITQQWTLSNITKNYMIWFLISAILIFSGIMIFLPAYSSFAASLLKASIGIFLFYLFDKFALKEVDTIEELKKGNIAYSIFLATIGSIICVAIISG